MLRKNKKYLSKHRLTLNLGALGTRRQASRAWRTLLRNNQDHSILCAVSEAVLHSSKKFIAPGRYRIYTVSTAVCQQKSIYRPLFYRQTHHVVQEALWTLTAFRRRLSLIYVPEYCVGILFSARDDCIWDQYQHFIEDDSLRKLCLAKKRLS